MFILHFDLTLKVAMVTENGRQYRLKQRKCHFGPQFRGFTDSVFENKISVQLNTKKIFYHCILCILLPFIIHLNIFWYLLVLYASLPVKSQDVSSKLHFFFLF